MINPASFAPLLERYFTQRLMRERQASPHTISSYRDTFRQFLKFVQQRLHKPPAKPGFEEIDAPLIVAFLDWAATIILSGITTIILAGGEESKAA